MDDDATDSEAPVVPETPGGRPATFRSLRHMRTTTSIVQVRADPQMHGRVLALQTVLLIGTTPIGAPLLGALADAAGPRSIVVVVAAAIAPVLAAAFGAFAGRRIPARARG